ncbi:hypothetical protein DFQ28_009118 [Apophysomyces sp. BC1034]|nr:hypothetical protein DFQ29_008795 [Apophysomyces sp. BC1021]KAG0185583.1 hypothetical protein DFQ28_009118 [Apophysomyces sp. BC1034]
MDLIDAEQKSVKSICGLIQKLPRVSTREDVNEAELCTRFIGPFLSGLFDDPDQAVERAYLCITKSLGRRWHHDGGFGEAKASKVDENMYLICKDLWRIAIFCKDDLDSQHMQGIMGIQTVGR